MDLSELLAEHDQDDLSRSIAEAVLQLIMEADADGLIGAGRHERTDGRTTWRNHCPAGECMHSLRGAIVTALSIPVSAR